MIDHASRSFKNRHLIGEATLCGCYYCLRIFSGKTIKEWHDLDQTPVCPRCGIDSVVPYNQEIDKSVAEFRYSLEKWNKESFG